MLAVARSSAIGAVVKPNDHFVPHAFFYPDHTVHVIHHHSRLNKQAVREKCQGCSRAFHMVFYIFGAINIANSCGNPENKGSLISIDRDTRTAWSCSREDATSVVML